MIDQDSLIKAFTKLFNEKLSPYLIKLRETLNNDQKQLFGFRHILHFSSIKLFIGKHHFAIEYSGDDKTNQTTEDDELSQITLEYFFFPDEEEILDRVLGYDTPNLTPKLRMPIPIIMENLFIPLGDSLELMVENGWNIDAQMRHQTTLLAFGPGPIGLTASRDEFASIRNSFIYNTDSDGNLIVRHLKWIDLFPINITETEDSWEIGVWAPETEHLLASALSYEPPELKKSQLDKLVRLNRFVELIISNASETQITRFLSHEENQFILKLYFSAKEIYSEVQLKWQNRTDRPDVRPDFFVTMQNGFADIVDFKLPNIKTAIITGKDNRKRFNAHLTEYAAQLREYNNFFDDSINRNYVETILR